MLNKTPKYVTVSDESVMNRIDMIREQKVMLDSDLAALYGVPTKVLKQAVKRNLQRFPEDFMFILAMNEFRDLRSQIVTSSSHTSNGWGGSRYPPMAFTELGVVMLSSILNSEQAIKTNIQIMRVFARLRELLLTHKDVIAKLELLEEKYLKHETDIRSIFNYLKKLMATGERKEIKGFRSR